MAGPYAVGIDLGTTHTVVAAARRDSEGPAEVFAIPQLVTPHEAASLPLLPSMLYAPADGESAADPFNDAPWVLGAWARARGALVPGRLVASSKSWLTHAGVDRRAPVLPWAGADDVPRISPVEAARRLLVHVARAWDAAHPETPLAAQDVILTVPASFDEVARELSLAAATEAGLAAKLLEEPQAAFYDWMQQAGWNRGPVRDSALAEWLPSAGEGTRMVLVVDVGGGTTDLSLVRVNAPEAGGSPFGTLERVAVGPHILLGGDNMDLALAHACEARLVSSPDRLDGPRFAQLVQACRLAKETLLGASPPDDAPVTVLASGSALVGAARSTRLTRDEAEAIVVDGFFPRVPLDSRPERARGGLVAFGLPYERDPAITRHVAAFVRRVAPAGREPDAVLLNGGVFRSPRIATRLLETLADWRGGPPLCLPGSDPDVAVARGAVAYARARAGHGVRIGGGSARGYFVGLGPQRAVCVVPRGAGEGQVHVARGRTFALAMGRPARFELLASDDAAARPGDVVDIDDRFVRLPPVTTRFGALEPGVEVPVVLEGELSPVGTVDLACVEIDRAPPRKHRLAFDLRDEPGPHAGARATASTAFADMAERPDITPLRGFDAASPDDALAPNLALAIDRLEQAFGKPRPDAGPREAKDLLRNLERVLGDRGEWTVGTSRRLFDALLPLGRGRRRSADHERVFWLLAGWCVRPGFGAANDEVRVAAFASLHAERLAFPQEVRGFQHYFIAARRAAGGLDEAAQTALRDYVDPHLLPSEGRRPKRPLLALDDALDMASSLERVAPARRAALGGAILERTWTDRDPRLWTMLGRLGARVPATASAHHVVSPAVAERWLDHLLREKWDAVPAAAAAAVLIARRTGDRARDVSDSLRAEVVRRLVTMRAEEQAIVQVRDGLEAGQRVRAALFGDSLPLGLRLLE